VAARTAGDDDLQVRFLANALRRVITLFVTAEPAPRGGRPFSRRLFIHAVRFTRASYFALPKQRTPMLATRLVAVVLALLLLNVATAQAERPIVDLHRFDAYFELFAADSNVPWKPATVRLDTYSSAPVAISVYAVDPVNVLTAGANFSPRAIDVARRRALASFSFTPPGGYQFQSNQVNLPLGNREGFFVVEARRGDVGEQVWIDRTRVGLVSKETPGGFLLYGMDLGTGMPLARMRIQFVVHDAFVTAFTGDDGTVRWNRAARPVFALAQWGASYAFLSLLPQAPVPAAIVGVRVDSAVVHAGGILRVAGFVRRHADGVLRAENGSVTVSLRNGPRTIAARHVTVDEAGAFATALTIPANVASGDYAVIAQSGGGAAGGASVHVDANAGSLSLDVATACGGRCDPRADVPLHVHASTGAALVRVTVVRSPHIYLGEVPESALWGTTEWYEATVRTDSDGNATVRVPHPLDDLASTYGITVESDGATAETRVLVPTANAVIHIAVQRPEQGYGTPVAFAVDAQRLDGKPLTGERIAIDLMHGNATQRQTLTLDAQGRARGNFSSPDLGTNMVFASVEADGRATDATQVQIDPLAPSPDNDGDDPDVRIALDASTYRSGETIVVSAQAAGAQGDALLTFESALGVQYAVARVTDGRAVAHFRAVDAAGELQAGAVMVHDGALQWSTVPVTLRGIGRAQVAGLEVEGAHLDAGTMARVTFDGAGERGTYVVRISAGTPSGSAIFSSAPELLAIGVSTTQSSAPQGTTWHPWVDSTGNHAQVISFVRRSQPPPDELLAEAETRTIEWKVVRAGADGVPIVLPQHGGQYVISVLDIADDGSVTAGISSLDVR
jgi:hypothetical protein